MTTPVSARLLVVDAEDSVRGMLTMALEFAGFRVSAASTGRQALELIARAAPDLVLLDVRLPDIDGFQVCRILRARGVTVPVLFLAGRGGVDDLVRGLDLGGDDFVTKPFELREVAARVRALLRRSGIRGAAPGPSHLSAGEVEMDLDAHQVRVSGRPLELTGTEFALLRCLLENPGRVLTREQLQERVWQRRTESGSVETYVYYLRRKLGDPGHTLIRTVRGVGYRLCVD
ncbi:MULTISPECIES: response regulator transcription factor [unclassified Streptomyces]|uniref:response regulator transcription factor n=1 Tax=unclassified Streptomyces TaxID=2593676 RepID=UPI000DDA6FBE|nr:MULTISPECIES: response regulator transcription factor [unclassified Streptomyces]QZZ30978.1 response regulator transcription factor [Streptomyces sp. ST1015]